MSQIKKYKPELQESFRNIVNTCDIDTQTNLPDFIIASYLYSALENLVNTTNEADHWVNETNNEIDESMDGDHTTALASAGFGTDEAYGGTDERF